MRRKRSGVFAAVLALAAGAVVIARLGLPPLWNGAPTAAPDAFPSPEAAFAEVGGLPEERPARAFVDRLVNTGYAVAYDENLLTPLWAAYYCGPKSPFEAGDRDRLSFSADNRIAERARLRSADFKSPANGPRFDRGHMAPNYAIATRYGEIAQRETFRLTNIVPQRSELNQTFWRLIDERIANRYAPGFAGVWVVVGPVFDAKPERLNGRAAIPAAFFCIVLDREESTGRLRALALIVPQEAKGNQRLTGYATRIREIERRTGLDFFAALPDPEETDLENSLPDGAWEMDSTR
mgnify:CR=1 FL=1